MSRKKVAGNKGISVQKRPSEYEMTDQQVKFKIVQKRCGIEKGIGKTELMEKMKKCIPEEWEKIKDKPLEKIEDGDDFY